MREGYGPQGGSKRSRITEHHIVKRQPPSMYASLWNENALQGIDQLAPFAHPTVRKIIVTGSVEVGQATGRTGGSAHEAHIDGIGRTYPVLVFDDADADAEAAARALAAKTLCNAIQDCISLTRFFIQGAFSTAFSPDWFRLSKRGGSGVD